MSHSGSSQTPHLPQPKVRIAAISEAWGLFKQKPWVWIAAMVTYVICSMVVNSVVKLFVPAQPVTPNHQLVHGLTTAFYTMALSRPQMISSEVSLLLGSFFFAGQYRMALKQIRGQEIEVADIFGGGRDWLRYLRAYAVVSFLPWTAFSFSMLIPYPTPLAPLWWTLLGVRICALTYLSMVLLLTIPLVVDRGSDAWSAIGESWKALKNQWLGVLAVFALLCCLGVVGAIPCGLGLLVVAPLFPLTTCVLYRDFFIVDRSTSQPLLEEPRAPSAFAPGRAGDIEEPTNPATPPSTPDR